MNDKLLAGVRSKLEAKGFGNLMDQVKIVFADAELLGKCARGIYNPNTRCIAVALRSPSGNRSLEDTLIHELGHALDYQFVPTKFQQRFANYVSHETVRVPYAAASPLAVPGRKVGNWLIAVRHVHGESLANRLQWAMRSTLPEPRLATELWKLSTEDGLAKVAQYTGKVFRHSFSSRCWPLLEYRPGQLPREIFAEAFHHYILGLPLPDSVERQMRIPLGLAKAALG